MTQHQHRHDYGPSWDGTVVLDIGGDVGALVVHTPADLDGLEIELARRNEDVPFVHTAVRERHLLDGTVHAAVFAEVPAGSYTLVGIGSRPSIPVTVTGGHVTELRW
jgi:hypothetical protein